MLAASMHYSCPTSFRSGFLLTLILATELYLSCSGLGFQKRLQPSFNVIDTLHDFHKNSKGTIIGLISELKIKIYEPRSVPKLGCC